MTIGHDCRPSATEFPSFVKGLSTCTSSEPEARCELTSRVHRLAELAPHKRWRRGELSISESQARSSWAHRFSLIVRDDQIVEVEIYFGIPHEAKGESSSKGLCNHSAHFSAHLRPTASKTELTNTTYVIFQALRAEVSVRATRMVLKQAVEKLTLGQ
jgi:hypothetical protein